MKNVNDTVLTRRQIETLEAVYHRGNPWLKKVGSQAVPNFVNLGVMGRAGGAVRKMVDSLHERRYLASDDRGVALTIKGLEALHNDTIAMKAISDVEIASRIEKRKRVEAEDKDRKEREQAEREAARQARNEASRKDRLEKLRALLDGFDATVFSTMKDDELLAFAEKVADIETIY